MVENTYNARIKHKRDTSANWTSADPVLLSGEIIVVDTDNGVRTKTGDGTSKYTQLPFDDELIYSKIDTKLDKSGGTMTGDIDMGDHELKNVTAADIDSIKLNGVYLTATDDTATGTDRKVTISGTSGSDDAVTLGGVYTPTDDTDAANKEYVDERNVFYFTVSGLDNSFTADKTYNEVKSAIVKERPIGVIISGFGIIYPTYITTSADVLVLRGFVTVFEYDSDESAAFGAATLWGTNAISVSVNYSPTGDITVKNNVDDLNEAAVAKSGSPVTTAALRNQYFVTTATTPTTEGTIAWVYG